MLKFKPLEFGGGASVKTAFRNISIGGKAPDYLRMFFHQF